MKATNSRLTPLAYIGGVLIVSVISFFALLLIGELISEGLFFLASAFTAIIIFLALIFFRRTFSAYRWLAVGLVFAGLFTIYPIISTFIISTTNMSGGHLLTKEQAIGRLESKTYLGEGADLFTWTAYEKDGKYLILFKNEEEKYYLGDSNMTFKELEDSDPEFPQNSEIPNSIGGYARMNVSEVVPVIEQLGELRFTYGEAEVRIQSTREAAQLSRKYSYDREDDLIVDNETGIQYFPVKGTFTSETGEELVPGFKVGIGFENYGRFLSNPGYSQPILRIILWNIVFAFFSVAISFAIGLMIAIIFDRLPGNRIIRTLLIIPYPIPILVSITVWKGLLNESMGLVTKVLESLFGSAPGFFTDQTWARMALIFINVYLSYPYFYILASGALKSIPNEIFEAAGIDGANGAVKFRFITMPLVLKILMPLLIASFSFNFNNFTLIWGYNAGLPAMADSIVPMGHTDLLISFVYRLGFSTANASNYGFAGAITVLLFIFVSIMVVAQLRSTRVLKEDT